MQQRRRDASHADGAVTREDNAHKLSSRRKSHPGFAGMTCRSSRVDPGIPRPSLGTPHAGSPACATVGDMRMIHATLRAKKTHRATVTVTSVLDELETAYAVDT